MIISQRLLGIDEASQRTPQFCKHTCIIIMADKEVNYTYIKIVGYSEK